MLVSPPWARRPVQSACAQVLIDATKRLAQLKPRELRHARVVTVLGFPDMFPSEICIFFDPAYFASFCKRDTPEECWTAKPTSELTRQLPLTIPAGLAVLGFDTVYRDATIDPPHVETGQIWLIGEL